MPTSVDKDSGLEVVPLWIGGSPVASCTGTRFPVHSAAQNKDVYLAESASKESANNAAEAAEHAFKSWRISSAASRREILERMTVIIQQRQEQLIRLQMEETSCSETWARFNITYTVKMLKEIAARVTQACSGDLPPMASQSTFGILIKEPIGPVLLIAP